MFLARLIPRVCHNVNRVCYIHGDLVRDQILDITPTYPTSLVLATARQVDHAATQVSLLYKQSIHVLWRFDVIKNGYFIQDVVPHAGLTCPKI